jgi:hypothetical protein
MAIPIRLISPICGRSTRHYDRLVVCDLDRHLADGGAPRKADAGVRSLRVDLHAIIERLGGRTQQVFADARGAERHAHLCQRLERLYGALELARLLEQGALARWIETHMDARPVRAALT